LELPGARFSGAKPVIKEIHMPESTAAIEYAQDHQAEILADLKDLLSIPSISTLPEHKEDITRAAEWIADKMRRLGFKNVALMPTARHPGVYGEWLQAGPDAPTLLLYGHYDVQPVDPLDEWDSDPFKPELREGNLFARGASDMKGQLIAHLKAIEALQQTSGLKVNFKFMIEGEEEIGSPSLEGFIQANKELLQADLCLNSDSGILAEDQPAITVGLRGLTYFELRLHGQRTDLHSGTFGGVVDNPALVMARLLAGMKDEHGHILLPGFYDDVRELTPHDREMLPDLSDEWWKEKAGVKALFGEAGYSTTERARSRPTFDVNGILSGFTGEGSKTVLPARAMAKFSMRLVPDQTPANIKQSLLKYLEQHIPETMTWELLEHSHANPAMIDTSSTAVQTAARAFEETWGKPAIYDRLGGTVPVVDMLQHVLDVDTLMLGFGLPDDNIHGPNEKQHMATLYRGVETVIRFLNEYRI
jgi:acetylornithine deacetylase/succinyl-diaminopimelate desuccinylase-like protein